MKSTRMWLLAAALAFASVFSAQAATAKFDNVSATRIDVSGTGVVISATKPGQIIAANAVSATNISATNIDGNQAARSYGNVASNGTFNGGYNVASASRSSTGQYAVTFTNAMNTANYAITATLNYFATTPGCTNVPYVKSQSTSGFNLQINGTCDTGTFNADIPWSFQVFEAR